jgi:hypothetical protein
VIEEKRNFRHGTKGRIVGPAVRQNALKTGLYSADLYSARAYVRRLMACLDSLGLATAAAPAIATDTTTAPAKSGDW